MKTIDRVMLAYRKTHQISEKQAQQIRAELSLFIDQLIADKLRKNETKRSRNCPETVSGDG